MERQAVTVAPDPFSQVDPKRRRLYEALDHPDDPELILENAEKVADAHGRDRLLDYLYAHARAPKASREVWTRQALVSSCIAYILEDFFAHKPPRSLRSLFDPEASAEAIRAMSSPRGVLALTFHGGFAALAPHFFFEFLPDSLIIGIKSKPKYRTLGAENPGVALFGALGALAEGRPVFIAPEGNLGKQARTVEVLGARLTVADGAAFLAHETGCDTVWYVLRRNGRLLAPTVDPGPRRSPGESYDQFRARLIEFYRCKIELHFTSDPQNLTVGKWWRGPLKSAMSEAARWPSP